MALLAPLLAAACAGYREDAGDDGLGVATGANGLVADPDATCPRSKTCGGVAGTPCDEGEYCAFPDEQACGVPAGPGICRPAPEVCALDCPGVCGCDGQFYCNACIAARDGGVDVDPDDVSCFPPPAGPCGGLQGLVCADGEYCDFPDDAFCGAADQQGLCQLRPAPEDCPMDCPGVCGCNDMSYCNACLAAADGVDVAAGATCSPSP